MFADVPSVGSGAAAIHDVSRQKHDTVFVVTGDRGTLGNVDVRHLDEAGEIRDHVENFSHPE